MRYTNIIATVAVLALGTQSALAAASKEENIGVGTGAIVGALAGGPVGLVIGAAFGAKLGDSLNKKSERIDTLQVLYFAVQFVNIALQHRYGLL